MLQERLVDLREALEDFRVGRNLLAHLDKVRTTYTLICTAWGLFRMVAAMIAPCSVKAKGNDLENLRLVR